MSTNTQENEWDVLKQTKSGKLIGVCDTKFTDVCAEFVGKFRNLDNHIVIIFAKDLLIEITKQLEKLVSIGYVCSIVNDKPAQGNEPEKLKLAPFNAIDLVFGRERKKVEAVVVYLSDEQIRAFDNTFRNFKCNDSVNKYLEETKNIKGKIVDKVDLLSVMKQQFNNSAEIFKKLNFSYTGFYDSLLERLLMLVLIEGHRHGMCVCEMDIVLVNSDEIRRIVKNVCPVLGFAVSDHTTIVLLTKNAICNMAINGSE